MELAARFGQACSQISTDCSTRSAATRLPGQTKACRQFEKTNNRRSRGTMQPFAEGRRWASSRVVSHSQFGIWRFKSRLTGRYAPPTVGRRQRSLVHVGGRSVNGSQGATLVKHPAAKRSGRVTCPLRCFNLRIAGRVIVVTENQDRCHCVHMMFDR
jgi:hypothetical protein